MSFTLPQYATIEDVKSATDTAGTYRSNVQIERALDAASRRVEDFTRRKFYPQIATRYFDWPRQRQGSSWRLWLDQNEVISLSNVVAGGVTIASTDYFLEPVNDGPPYNRFEIDLASDASLAAGDTHQRQIVLTGLWGYNDVTAPAGALAEALDSSETGVDVTDSLAIGIGDVIVVGSERMLVTGKSQVDTTADCSTLTAVVNSVSITGVTNGLVAQGEVITVDSEKMLVTDVTGTTLTVKRGWDGSVLAAHSSGTTIYAPRSLTVVRGALGTTAAAHDTASAVSVQRYPGPIKQLTIAYAMDQVQQEQSAYARTIGDGESLRQATGRAIANLEASVARSYRRLRLGRGI